jgi:hypothetical protein
VWLNPAAEAQTCSDAIVCPSDFRSLALTDMERHQGVGHQALPRKFAGNYAEGLLSSLRYDQALPFESPWSVNVGGPHRAG